MLKKRLTDYFIPHAGNNYAPHSLQKAAMLGMLVMIVLSFAVANVQSLLWISSKTMVSSVLPAVIVDLTNKARVSDSLGSLHRNALLDEAATLKAQDMAKYQYFAHYSPTGVSPWFWFKKVSYNFVNAGENLAIEFTDSSAIVDAWMASPEHRANILNGKYTEIGVGTAEGDYEGYHTVYVVQLFGTPAQAPAVAAAKPVAPAVPVKQVAVNDTASSSVLAESVSVTEQTKIIPAPVQAVVQESSSSEATTSSSTPAQASSSLAVLANTQGTNADFALYSDLITTTTNALPAQIHIDNGESTQLTHASPVLSLATKPNLVLQLLYIFIGLFVFISLLLSIFIEIRHQEPLQIAYGVALLVLMFGLFYIHLILGGNAVIV